MPLRLLLILAFLVQQLMLPALGAHGTGHCQAGKQAAIPKAAICCAVLHPAIDSSDSSSRTDERIPGSGCTCIPSLCACGTNHAPDPVAPERQNRSIDQLIAFMALPMDALPELPKAVRAIQSHDLAVVVSDTGRRLSILCMWRT